MVNKKNILFVSSPLQAINAISAIKQFKLDSYGIIIANHSEKVFNTILKILNNYCIRNYKRIEFDNFWSLIKYYYRNKNHFNCSKIEKIFVGDFESRVHVLLASMLRTRETQIFFMDDGNNTIQGYKNNFKITKSKKYRNINNIVKFFVVESIINRKKIRKNFIVFSVFPPIEQGEFKYIKNNLSFLKREIVNSQKKSGIYIVGSNLVELGRIEKKQYLKCIEKIIRKFDKIEIFYIPHRRENIKKLSLLMNSKKFNLLKNNTSIELLFIDNKIYPEIIYGFRSSALFTLKVLFPYTKINNLILENNFKTIANYYKHFGIKNIKLRK